MFNIHSNNDASGEPVEMCSFTSTSAVCKQYTGSEEVSDKVLGDLGPMKDVVKIGKYVKHTFCMMQLK